MDIAWSCTTNDNDSQESDYHISLMHNNSISHRNYPNVHNNNVHCTVSIDRDHMDRRCDASFPSSDCYDDSRGAVDGFVVDGTLKNENDAMTNGDSMARKEDFQGQIWNRHHVFLPKEVHLFHCTTVSHPLRIRRRSDRNCVCHFH